MLRVFKILSLAFILVAILILRPVPKATEKNIDTVIGVVKSIHEGGEQDIVFILDDNPTRYYINRGLDQGLELGELKEDLLGKKVEISYPQYWTPLDHRGMIRHLSRLRYGEEVVFDEVHPNSSI